ncbi:MAG TPA: TrmO family methyltransferase [Tabrizicola sp.]|nr:TrmO family methyltransferase [Tabrizicola sp.]
MPDPSLDKPLRPGEVVLRRDPGQYADAQLHFIGRLRSPWSRGNCPKNLREARERGGEFRVEVDAAFRPALKGLQAGQALVLLYWTGDARRDMLVLAPPHRDGPTGVFALRSPSRPNPIAVGVVGLLSLDAEAGLLTVDALDAFDGTPLLDIKPWIPTVDIPPSVT